VLVGAAIPLVHAAVQPALRHGRSTLASALPDNALELGMRMVSGVPNALPLSVEMPSTVHFSGLGENPEPIEECGCDGYEEDEDDGSVCSCSKAMKVLQCVTHGCASGGCNCHNRTLVDACDILASKCDNLQFSCSARKAACDSHEELESRPTKNKTKKANEEKIVKKVEDIKSDNVTVQKEVSYDEVYEKLASLKEDKCSLQFAMSNGHNVDKKLQGVMEEIDQKIEELNKACQKLPEMHCYKHFEEWHEPSCNNSVTKSGAPLAKSGAPRATLAATACAALVAAASFAVAWS